MTTSTSTSARSMKYVVAEAMVFTILSLFPSCLTNFSTMNSTPPANRNHPSNGTAGNAFVTARTMFSQNIQ